jgi:uncharacterized protein
MLYFDTSFLTPLIRTEATSSRVERFVRRQRTGQLAISRWTQVELSSVLGREVRMGALDGQTAIAAEAKFDSIVQRSFVVLLATADDFDLARRYLRRHEAGLRGGDALHLAIAVNNGASRIFTLDKGMLRAGRLLSLPARTGIRVAGY